MIYGNACGALSVSEYGGNTGTTNIQLLEKFIADRIGETKETLETTL